MEIGAFSQADYNGRKCRVVSNGAYAIVKRECFYFRTITLPLPWWVARISTSAICTWSGAFAA